MPLKLPAAHAARLGLSATGRKGGPTEAEFMRQVIALASLHHWRVAHFRGVRVQRKDGSVYYQTPVQADGAGWPDLILVRGERIIAAELKVGKNRTTAEQDAWLSWLAAAGVDTWVWRPDDWPTIEEVLR